MKSEHQRALLRALEGLNLTRITFRDHKGHIKMTVIYEGRQKTFEVAGSPRDLGDSVKEVVRDVKRFVKGQYK